MSDDIYSKEMDANYNFHWKEKDEVGEVKHPKQIRCRWQNIPTKLPGVIGHIRKATTPFE
jgi:hypothetical protein